MTDTMTPGEAYQTVVNYAEAFALGHVPQHLSMADAQAALAVLREHHAHFSRYKMGDAVFRVWPGGKDGAVIVSPEIFIGPWPPEWQTFPTRELAEAEAAKRNQETP